MNNFKRVKKLGLGGLSSFLTTPKPTVSSVTQPWYLQINPNSPLALLLQPSLNFAQLVNQFNIGSVTPTSKSSTSTGILSKLNISKDQIGSMLGSGIDMMSDMMFNDTVDSKGFDAAMSTIDGIGDAAGLINPMLGVAAKGLGFAVKGINSLGAKKSQDFSADYNTIEEVGSSYGDSVAGIQDAASKAGKKYGLFSNRSRKRANKLINKMRDLLNIISDIADKASDMRSIATNMSDINHLAYALNMAGGYDLRFMRAAKHGGNLTRIKKIDFRKQGGNIKGVVNFAEEFIPEIVDLPETFKDSGKIEEFVPEIIKIFKEGGKVETEESSQKNLIPEGALHARKHHMENDENITKKGIPVIDNDGEQQAEIEHSELIFTLEVTKKLEELQLKYYETNDDLYAIEAGKLLVQEILYNTDDRTDLIKSCKEGGVL